jgi:hypothetical protein
MNSRYAMLGVAMKTLATVTNTTKVCVRSIGDDLGLAGRRYPNPTDSPSRNCLTRSILPTLGMLTTRVFSITWLFAMVDPFLRGFENGFDLASPEAEASGFILFSRPNRLSPSNHVHDR